MNINKATAERLTIALEAQKKIVTEAMSRTTTTIRNYESAIQNEKSKIEVLTDELDQLETLIALIDASVVDDETVEQHGVAE